MPCSGAECTTASGLSVAAVVKHADSDGPLKAATHHTDITRFGTFAHNRRQEQYDQARCR